MSVSVLICFMLSGVITESKSDYTVMTSCSDDAVCSRASELGRSVVNCVLLRRDLNLSIYRGILKEWNVGTSLSSSAFQNCAGQSEQCATNIFITEIIQLNSSLLIASQSKWPRWVMWFVWSSNKQHLISPSACELGWIKTHAHAMLCFDHLDKRNSSSWGLKTCLPVMYTTSQHWQPSPFAQDISSSKSGTVMLTTS